MLNLETCLLDGEGIIIHTMQEYKDFIRVCTQLGYRLSEGGGEYHELWGSVYFTLGYKRWMYFCQLRNAPKDRHLVEWSVFRSQLVFTY